MTSSLLIMAAIVVALNAQTDVVPVLVITTPPTVRLFTADEIAAGGGEGECRWETEAYGECSETCAGRQSREVFCQCTLPTTEQVRATDDNCVRDDVRLRPIEERSCGIECPEPTTQPPTTQPPTTLTPTTQTPSAVCRWTSADFSVCSATCEGTQTRAVTCVCVLPSGGTTTVSDDVCDSEDPRIKPLSTRSCGVAECPPPPTPDCGWVTGPFSDCSATCEGTQDRSVSCQCTLPTGSPIVASGSGACGGDEPSASQRCGDAECPPVCTWNAGRYSACSATCEGTQTRAVTCACVLRTGSTTSVSDDVCDREDPRVQPQTTRSCGIECPPTTDPPTTDPPTTDPPTTYPPTTYPPTTECPRTPEATREPRECNLTECQDQSDCYDDECCRQVYMGRGNTDFFCFPLLQSGDGCDPEENFTCPCAKGLECNSSSAHGHGRSKRKKGPKYMAHVKFENGDKCPWLYKESKEKYRTAVCVPAGDQPGTVVIASGDRPLPINTVQPGTVVIDSGNRPIPSNSTSNRCNLTECDDQSDCDEDECCLEVTRKKDKRHGNHNYNSTTFCFPHVDEDEACDLNGNWSCPCRDGLICTEGGRSRGKRKAKKKKDHSKDYRLTVTWEEGEECPTLYKKSNKKPSKDAPTCQEESRRRSGRATTNEEEYEENSRPVVFVSHWN